MEQKRGNAMISANGVVVGFVPDCRIRDVSLLLERTMPAAGVLISSVDSGYFKSSADVAMAFRMGRPTDSRVLEYGLWMPMNVFGAWARERGSPLSGFATVWLWMDFSRVSEPPEFWLTSEIALPDRFDCEPSALAGLSEWMTTSGCKLGLGDGCGLNYVTTERILADILEKAGDRDAAN